MIAEEVARVRRAAVGLTAEQILSKVMRDSNSLTILTHLLQEVNEQQRERLLLELLPTAYEEISGSQEPFDDRAERLQSAYRVILESVTPGIRKRVASEFVRVLREEDGDRVVKYGAAFFKPVDLKFVSPPHQAMVREHLLGRVPSFHTINSLKLIDGISEHLQPADVLKWLDPFMSTLASTMVKESVKQRVRTHLIFAVTETSDEVNAATDRRLDDWIRHYEKGEAPDRAEFVRELKKEIIGLRILF